ncbi:MAG: acyltransferase family protein [Chloroflexota bacterium]
MLGGAVSTPFVSDYRPRYPHPIRQTSATRDPAPAGRSGTLPYLAAIDGLRALAVTAVLIYHAQIGALPGGFLGVEVFFVISGYLITSLLLTDRASTGHVSLLAFWKRRAKRLLPALFGLIIAALVYTVVFLPGEVASLRLNALASFGYVSNWYLIFDQQSYFESLGRPSLLRHLWSLAVEEQFYLVWPIVFALLLGRIRRRYAIAIILAGAIASAALMAYLYNPAIDPSRIYYGTDTRAAGLLIGAALAFAWQIGRLPERAIRLTRRVADLSGAGALAGLFAISALATEQSAFLYRGGFVLVAVLTAVLIAACVHPGSRLMPGVLGRQPLTWIGTRSYSIYLWHWPVFMLTRPELDVSLDGAALFALRLAITAVVAEVSYRFVERPVRNGALGGAWQSLKRVRRPAHWPAGFRPLVASGAAGAGVIFLGITVAAATPPAPPSYLAVPAVNIVSWSQPGAPTPTPRASDSATDRPTLSPTPLLTPSPTAAGIQVSAPPTMPPVTPPPTPTAPPPLASPPKRLIAVGDSVMLGAANQLAATVPNAEVDAAVSRQVSDGIAVLEARRQAGALGDVVIIHLGTNGSFTSGEFDQIMDILAGVQRVVFVNLKVPRDWEGGDNAILAEGVTRHPNALLVDWHTFAGAHPEFFYEDGIHLNPDGAAYYAQLIAGFAR